MEDVKHTVAEYSVGKTFMRLMLLTRRYFGWFVILLLSSVVASGIEIGYMETIRWIISGATEKQVSFVYSGIVLGVVVIAGRLLNNGFATWLKATLNNKTVLELQTMMMWKLTNSRLRDVQGFTIGDLSGRAWDSARDANSAWNDKFIALFSNIVQLILAFAYFSWLNVPLAVGIIAFTLLHPLVTFPLTRFIKKQHDRRNERVAQRDSFLVEAIHGQEEVRTYSLRGLFENKVRQQQNEILKNTLTISKVERFFEAASRLSMFGGMLFILCYGGYQVLLGNLGLGGLTAILVTSGQLTNPIRSLSGLWTDLIGAISQAHRVFQILDLEEEDDTGIEGHTAVTAKQGVCDSLRMQHITYSHEGSNYGLIDVSLSAKRGQITAIIGPSGAGKSTILKLIMGLYRSEQGQMMYGENSVECMDLKQWRNEIAYVPQEALLITGTLRDNIAFGQEKATDEEVMEAARQAHIHETLLKQPQGYHTEVATHTVNLSGGERQRLALARALLRKCPILLLDEPTSSQDALHEKEMMESLKKVAADTIVIMISHQRSSIVHSDHIIYMDQGRVIETGTNEQLMTTKGPYYQFMNKQESAGGLLV